MKNNFLKSLFSWGGVSVLLFSTFLLGVAVYASELGQDSTDMVPQESQVSVQESEPENTCTDGKVACIGNVGYATLAAAVNEVQEGETIILNSDATETNFSVTSDQSFTLDINGQTLTLNNVNYYDYIYGSLTIIDSGNGKVIVDDYGIMPGAGGTLTIENGTFENNQENGYMFYLYGGTLHIIEGTFNGYYNIVNCYAADNNVGGGTVIIDGGYFSTIADPEYGDITIQGYENSDITINGGTFIADNSEYSYAFVIGKGSNNNGNYTPATATIKGGIFNGIVGSYDDAELLIKGGEFYGSIDENSDGDIQIEGGSFSEDPSEYVGERYEVTKPEEMYVVAKKDVVAMIGDIEYYSLEKAVEAVTSSTQTEIKLVSNYAIKGNAGVTINANKNILLDLNGHTLSNLVNENKASQVITNNGILTITDTSDSGNGMITNSVEDGAAPGERWSTPQYNYATNVITNKGILNINGGTIYETAAGSICYAVDNNSTSNDTILTVNGGVLRKDSGTAVRMFCNSITKENTINMNDGLIEGGYTAIWVQLPGSNGQAKKATLNIQGGTLKGGSYAFYDYSYGDVFTNVQYNLEGGTFNGDIFSYGANINISGGIFNGDVAIKQALPSNVSVLTGTFNGDVYTYGDSASEKFIEGGSFDSITYEYEGETYDSDWTFLLADGYGYIKDSNKRYIVTDTFPVVFNSNGGSEVATQNVKYGEMVIQPTSTLSCNRLDGWYNGDTKYDFSTPVTGELTLMAHWTYTCSRSSGGGGGSSRTNNEEEIVLGGEVELDTGDVAEVNNANENTIEPESNAENVNPTASDVEKYGQELVGAYIWARDEGITTMPTIEQARLSDGITRAELAKMMVVFMSDVLKKTPAITGDVVYKDVSASQLGDLAEYIQKAYQYQIMGINADGTPLVYFNPEGKVSRAEFATVLSRVLFGDKYNVDGVKYYEKHIQALAEVNILTNTDPNIQEARGWIILMLYRSQKSEIGSDVVEG